MLIQKDLIQTDWEGDICLTGPMPSTKIEGFLREFPWIKDLINGPIRQVYVSRVEEAQFIDYCPMNMLVTIFTSAGEVIYLLNNKHQVVRNETSVTRKRFLFWGSIVKQKLTVSGIVRGNSSVKRTLDLLGDKIDDIKWILSYVQYTGSVIVYKMPQKFSLGQFMKSQTKLERKKFEEAIDKID